MADLHIVDGSQPHFPVRGRMIAITVLAGLLVVAAMSFDPTVNAWVTERATPGAKRVAEAFSRSGEAQWPIGVALVGIIVAWRYARPDWRRVALAVLLATAFAGLTAMAGRALTGRARPYNPVEQGWFGPYHNGQWVGLLHAYSSFPSGHSATSAGFATR